MQSSEERAVTEALESPETVLSAQRARLEESLRAVIPEGPLALLDFPNYGNVGDSAIWLGELEMCRRMRRPPPAYQCQRHSFDPDLLGRVVPEGAILLHGGGNFGDLWPKHQEFRELVLSTFPDRVIVQLPQSICFQSATALDRARRAVGAHPCFTLLVRDLESLEFARKYFDSPVSLCPDPSVVLRPPDRHIQQRDDLLFLSRDDHEGYGVATGNMHDRRFPAVDWTRESRGAVEVYNWLLGAARFFQSPPMAKLLHPITPVIYLRLAEMRFARGCELLGGSRVVVANRLHAHLMCLILGIPHFLSDTRYGKLRAYYKTWTSTSDLGVFCDSETDALEKAVTFLGTHRSKALP